LLPFVGVLSNSQRKIASFPSGNVSEEGNTLKEGLFVSSVGTGKEIQHIQIHFFNFGSITLQIHIMFCLVAVSFFWSLDKFLGRREVNIFYLF
jgi:hypothetical protein